MGLLDNLENQALGSVLGNNSNPLAAGLLQMIQNQPGGLQGMVQSFHDKGMGGVVSSWVGSGRIVRFPPTRFIRFSGAIRSRSWPPRRELILTSPARPLPSCCRDLLTS